MEISNNKHFVSRCTIEFNELFDDFIILFDTGVISEIFTDKNRRNYKEFFLFFIRFIPLQGFDDNITGSGPVIHFVYIFFAPPGHKP